MDPMQDNASLLYRLAHGEGSALEPLMEVWGDHLLDTCFRALRDAGRALDLYAEVWATIYDQIRYGTQSLPRSFGPWAVEIIADLLAMAASEGRIPNPARHRMKLAPRSPTMADIERIDALRDPTAGRMARDELPRDFSAAADRMLLHMPGPAVISRIRPSAERHL
jgi:DNA-directed RNA polymerase specialized sigma24 family protein